MTEQIAEKLTYNGKVYELYIEPLSPYLYKHTIESSVFTSYTRTDCWGHWSIEDDKLYLIELDRFEEFSIQELDRFEDVPIRNILNDLFPGQQKVFAEWYSGSIHTTLDDMYMYFDFKIEKGRLVEVEKKESEYIGVGHDSTFDLSSIV